MLKTGTSHESGENVTSMHITRTIDTFLPNDIYIGFSNLTNLRVEFTDIASLSKIDTLRLHNLHNLYLGNNKISRVANDTFTNLKRLKLLYLNNNKLTQLPHSTFEKLRNLERLWLNDNHLTELHAELLSENKKLNRLYLQNNRLLVIAEGSFNNEALKVVNLKGNVCINKWTVETPMNIIRKVAEKDCNASAENIRMSSIVMAKIMYELSVREITFHTVIASQELKIAELEERLSMYEEL